MDTGQLIETLATVRLSCATEDQVQRGLAAWLDGLGIPYEREKILSKRDRIDFYLSGLGIECKISGSVLGVTRQLRRYAEHDAIKVLLLVTNRRRLQGVPLILNDKPVHVHILGGL